MGGTLVPDPGPIKAFGTGADGVQFGVTLPADVPPGMDLYLQYWVQDPGATFGFAASNALHAVTQ